MSRMFRDIFNGKNGQASLLQDFEMHFITRSGSLEAASIEDQTDAKDPDDEHRCSKDPMTGRLSAVDAAFSSLPCHLIDKHWQWVTVLDLSRNNIR